MPVRIGVHARDTFGQSSRAVQGHQGVGCRRGALAKAAATKTPTLWNSAGVFTIAQGQ
ncbi:hypothetical protein XCV4072 [Xanthomonas euvesicatoria pv. vesicatoria str. 85-10]|uniref:Uncharacterized protein n=1 Tax=Xanthomonas euvesicatoria pv. vesicatoria (strain 85-10) TaxID=316273 RepID=Q3BN60_XANE5|nr:hypothetical protein XCV4072 [Xanthomonas euvesicatoria pv. vesicatoria str. 85-10]